MLWDSFSDDLTKIGFVVPAAVGALSADKGRELQGGLGGVAGGLGGGLAGYVGGGIAGGAIGAAIAKVLRKEPALALAIGMSSGAITGSVEGSVGGAIKGGRYFGKSKSASATGDDMIWDSFHDELAKIASAEIEKEAFLNKTVASGRRLLIGKAPKAEAIRPRGLGERLFSRKATSAKRDKAFDLKQSQEAYGRKATDVENVGKAAIVGGGGLGVLAAT